MILTNATSNTYNLGYRYVLEADDTLEIPYTTFDELAPDLRDRINNLILAGDATSDDATLPDWTNLSEPAAAPRPPRIPRFFAR